MRLHVRVHVRDEADRAGGFLVVVVRIGIEKSSTATHAQASMMLAYMPAQPYVAVLFLGLQARRT